MIPSYEAIYQSKMGKNVLMLDKSSQYGGAWTPIKLFGFEEVENAIHYFLPDAKGLQFMRETLKWDLENSLGKYRVFDKPVLGIRRIAYNNPFADFIVDVHAAKNKLKLLKSFFNSVKNWLTRNIRISLYAKSGSADILRRSETLLNNSKVELRYSASIEEIFIDSKNKFVEVVVNENGKTTKILSKKICITHGSKIKSLKSPTGEFEFENKIHPRPAAHLLVEDKADIDIFEAVFSNNKLIKYCHNITRFAKNTKTSSKEGIKIFVFSLQHDVSCYEAVYEDIFKLMKGAGLVGTEAKLLDHCWWDITLPTLDDNDLENFKNAFGDQVLILKTENFCRGIGLCADRWKNMIEATK